MQIADAHTHLDDAALDATRSAVMARAARAGVRRVVIAGTRPSTWPRTRRVAAEVGATHTLGVHPWWADELDDAALAELTEVAKAGIGELGLDWVRGPDRAVQTQALRRQLALARERDLPVVLHCVRAYPELIRTLRADGVPQAGGFVHGWSGPPDAVDSVVELGLHVSFGPLVTRSRAKRARASATRVPTDRLLVETDCPDGTAEPTGVLDVVHALAELRGEAAEALAAAAAHNLDQLLPA